ncbi:hypothetical protein [Mycolicibacterium sp. CBMA 234]|uniref:hypothetical protein n=1 Tax=Mycolicibacterium sp. CBMA 234 TaxID=1918495 RepID=UPI0012DBCD0C|nr:hypothetical protein [Mycolicibacterium sp. CBMA 234]
MLAVVAVVLAVIMILGGAALGAAFTSDADRKAPVRPSISVMAKAWLVSFVVVIAVGIATEGIGLPLALGVCAIGLLITHSVLDLRASSTTPRKPSPQEVERARMTQEFGVDGVAMLNGAQVAIDRIKRSEAATGGWLGNPQDLEFTADLTTIRENCRATMDLSSLIKELSDLADPGSEDMAMLDDARAKVHQLEAQSRERVKALRTCAEKAEEIDQSLQDDRVRARLAEKRDDVRSRMAAKLYGIDAAPSQTPSSSVDKITALAAAYAEIRGKLNRETG